MKGFDPAYPLITQFRNVRPTVAKYLLTEKASTTINPTKFDATSLLRHAYIRTMVGPKGVVSNACRGRAVPITAVGKPASKHSRMSAARACENFHDKRWNSEGRVLGVALRTIY